MRGSGCHHPGGADGDRHISSAHAETQGAHRVIPAPWTQDHLTPSAGGVAGAHRFVGGSHPRQNDLGSLLLRNAQGGSQQINTIFTGSGVVVSGAGGLGTVRGKVSQGG